MSNTTHDNPSTRIIHASLTAYDLLAELGRMWDHDRNIGKHTMLDNNRQVGAAVNDYLATVKGGTQ